MMEGIVIFKYPNLHSKVSILDLSRYIFNIAKTYLRHPMLMAISHINHHLRCRRKGLLFFLIFCVFLCFYKSATATQPRYKKLLATAYHCETDSCFQATLLSTQPALTSDTARAFQDYIRYFYYLKTERFDSADYYYPMAIAFDYKIKNWPIYFNTINARINSLRDRVFYEQALIELREAISIAKMHNCLSNQAILLTDLGLVYHEMGLYADGVKHAKEALSIFKNLPDQQAGYMGAINTIAINFDDWEKPDSALFYHYINVNLGFENVPSSTAASTYNNIGNTYLKQQQLDSAIRYFNKALAIAQVTQNVNNLATVYNNLGDIYLQQGKPVQAKHVLDSALVYANISQYAKIEKLRDVYNTLCRYYQKTGDMANAFEYQSLFITYRDSLRNMEQIQQIKRLELQAQTAKKDEEIAKSKLEIKNRNLWIIGISAIVFLLVVWVRQLQLKRQRVAQEATLKLQEERLRISRDLHDNIGAELSYITSVIDQKAYNQQDPERKKEYDLLSDSSRRAMSQLRETIWAIKTKDITLQKFGEKLSEFKSTYASIDSLTIDVDAVKSDLKLSPAMVINLYRVCQESVTNAIKHSNCSTIEIKLTVENHSINLTVKDNGVGFDSNSIDMGYGLQNMEERIQELNGTFTLNSAPNHGTTVQVTAPLFY
mgnify:CR=1 FL=1